MTDLDLLSEDEAIEHAFAAGDPEQAARLIEQDHTRLLTRGELATGRARLQRLPEEALCSRPLLCVLFAMSAGRAGRTEEAERLLRVAESSLSPVPDTPEARALAGTMAYVRGRMAGMCGDLARAVELAHLARGLAPASDTSMQVSIANMLGYAHFMRGDAEQATEVLGDAVRLARTGTSCNHSVSTLCLLARVRCVQGRLREAADLYREARQMIEEQGERQLDIAPSHPCRAAYCTVSF